MRRKAIPLAMLCLTVVIGGCSSDSATTLDPRNASTILSALAGGVVNVGAGLGGAARRKMASRGKAFRGVDDVCDEHAQVLGSVATPGDAEYPALVHYCLLAKNTYSPDSVQGGYALLVNVTCAVNAAGGVTFDGTPSEKTLAVTTDCFQQDQIDEIGSSIDVTITGTLNPTFAPHFSHGVELSIPMASMTFKYATKVTGTLSEIISVEDGDGDTGFAGAFDSATEKVWFETRINRFDDSCRSTRDCGWSRHFRLYGDTSGLSSEIVLDGYSGVYTDVQKTGLSGSMSTVSGNTAEGLFARGYNNSGGTREELADPTSVPWVFINDAGACVNIGGGATCTSNTGIDAKSSAANGDFLLIPVLSRTFSDAATWAAALTGLTFTSVTFADQQF